MKEPGRIKRYIQAWKSIFVGMGISIRRVKMPEATLMYPYEKAEMTDRFRGAPMVKQFLGESDDKEGACIACGLCEKACPVNCITVERNKDKESPLKVADWQLDLTKCMFCGLCAEVCPTNAVVMSHDYEYSKYLKDQLVYDKEQVLRRKLVIPVKTEASVEE